MIILIVGKYTINGCYGWESYEELKNAQTVFCITKKNLLRLNISGLAYFLHWTIGEYLHFGAWNCWLLKWPLQVAAVEKEKHLLQQT